MRAFRPGFLLRARNGTEGESSPADEIFFAHDDVPDRPPLVEELAPVAPEPPASWPAAPARAYRGGRRWSYGPALVLAVFGLGGGVGAAITSFWPPAEPPQAAVHVAAPSVFKLRIEAGRGTGGTHVVGAGKRSKVEIVFRVPARAKGIRVAVTSETAAAGPARLQLRLGGRDARVLTRETRVKARFKRTNERRRIVLTVSSNRPSIIYRVRYRVL